MSFKLILKGKYILIDIREMYQKDGEDRPGKGIALNPEQYNNIKVRSAFFKLFKKSQIIKMSFKNNADDIDKLW